nr:reverse transcriptase domain-containing protein [Tanacetum cinerariifolium]
MFKQLHINITLADALILITKYLKMLKALLSNKKKLLKLANTPHNENCSAVILKKLPEKLGDPGEFLISCGFSELKCKALADLGASINLMPLSVWKRLGLPELISTRITLELANRAICTPAGIARDVFVSVGKFTFPADFVIVDYESDPRVPLILGRHFLRIVHALIDVHGEDMILRDGDWLHSFVFVTHYHSVIYIVDSLTQALLSNKEKRLKLANTPHNENCSAVILKKLPEKLRDPGEFLISCGFSELKCKALADLGASINLMPLSVWKRLGLPELISTRITLELANRAICTPARIARDVFVPVGKFTFPADFVIVDYESDPRVPLILGRHFLRTVHALIDVHGEDMILRDGDWLPAFSSLKIIYK